MKSVETGTDPRDCAFEEPILIERKNHAGPPYRHEILRYVKP